MDMENLKRDITRLKSFVNGTIHRGDLYGADVRVIAAAESLLAGVPCQAFHSQSTDLTGFVCSADIGFAEGNLFGLSAGEKIDCLIVRVPESA